MPYWEEQVSAEDLHDRYHTYFPELSPPFHFFDRTQLVSLDTVLQRLEQNYPALEMTKAELEQYVEQGYFPELHMDDGERGFMLHADTRAAFIKEISAKWGYGPRELREITGYEDAFIDAVLAYDDLDYSDLPPLDFLTHYLHDSMSRNQRALKTDTQLTVKEKRRKQNKLYGRFSKRLKKTGFNELPAAAREAVNDAVFEVNSQLESIRLKVVCGERARVAAGFSPAVNVPDMKETSPGYGSADSDDAFPYSCIYEGSKCFFSKWEFVPEWIRSGDAFFATPEFYIARGRENRLRITVRDTQRVDSEFMREIEIYYLAFRNSADSDETEDREDTEREAAANRRKEALRERVRKLRTDMHSEKAETHLKRAMEEIAKELRWVSHAKAKRIIEG